MNNNCFYTFKEYMKNEKGSLTASMQDYLEMIYKLSVNTGFIRVHELSDALNVKPPSATKMVQKLAKLKLIKYEKYGVLILKEEGRILGEKLLNRHNIINNFLTIIGVPESQILTETEKIEHAVSKKTEKCLENFIKFSKDNQELQLNLKATLK